MNYTDIYFEIIAEGGITLNHKKERPVKGYMVAKSFPTRTITIGVDNPEETIYEFSEYAEKHHCWWGAWHKKETDELVFDIVENIDTLEEAVERAILQNQEALYDVANKKDIYVPTGQGAGTLTQKSTYAKKKAQEFAKGFLALLILAAIEIILN